MNVNKAIILGRVTRDPELRTIPSGAKVITFGMATNEFYTDKSGQRQQTADFHNIVFWNKQAETIAQYVKKGSLLYVEGRLATRSWEQDGVKKYMTEIIGRNFQLAPKSTNSGSSSTRSQPSGGEQHYEPDPQVSAVQDVFPGAESVDDEEVSVEDIPF